MAKVRLWHECEVGASTSNVSYTSESRPQPADVIAPRRPCLLLSNQPSIRRQRAVQPDDFKRADASADRHGALRSGSVRDALLRAIVSHHRLRPAGPISARRCCRTPCPRPGAGVRAPHARSLGHVCEGVRAGPQQSRYAYVYAIALNTTGARDEALRVLEVNHQRHQADRETLTALVSLNREAGDDVAARRYAEMARLAPGNPAIARLLEELRASRQK
jgi:hypothetical protein